VIVLDTCVISAAFRRRRGSAPESPEVAVLRRLVAEDEPLAVPGVVLQELLSGVRTETEFARLQRLMTGFPLLLATREHHLRAAGVVNDCRRGGVPCSAVDALIAALAIASNALLFTTDRDFARMAPHCGLRLFESRA
jgi:predicted nucleic acid-binding protein